MNLNMFTKGGSASGGKYYFILGSNPTLSAAELSAVFSIKDNAILAGGTEKAMIIDIDKEIDCKKLIERLGGTVKIGRIVAEIKNYDTKKILSAIDGLIDYKAPSGKFKFGFSYYGNRRVNIKVLGMELKKNLKENGISSRWVISREPVLSSVVVAQNKLDENGLETCLIQDGDRLLIGKTETVQPFKELSYRDYGRPARDDLSGMLPPKLAQIMINLAMAGVETHFNAFQNRDAVTLDPFCGSGTILTEAILMGYTNLIGSDISAKAVEDTKINIQWIINKYNVQHITYNIQNFDARQISQKIKPNSIDAIITEPFLGPQRGKVDADQAKAALEKLYSECLVEFKKILKPKAKIVMIWPVFRRTKTDIRLSPCLTGYKIINPIPEILVKNNSIKLTSRNTIIYGRKNQKVWREIVILEKHQ